MKMNRMLRLFFILLCAISAEAETIAINGIKWREWSPAIFEEAKRDGKFIVLDLEAIWCHWCHVMDKVTYANNEVIQKVNKNFIAVKVDQDSNPELSVRYQDYGWPATIFFNPAGEEVLKESGYIEPEDFIRKTSDIIAGKKINEDTEDKKQETFAGDVITELKSRHEKKADLQNGGLLSNHKFLHAFSVELTARNAINNVETQKAHLALTLDSNLKLIDPVWGGAFQYSTHGDWDHAHFEKIISTQSDNLKLYSLGYSIFKDEKYLKAARAIQKYLSNFLTDPNGAFYTSQDADVVRGEHSEKYFALNDAERRKIGIPAVDKNIYAKENGFVISALAEGYSFTGEQGMLNAAARAAEWIIEHRMADDGGFRHGEKDSDARYLGDTLSMARAFISLYLTTADKKWLVIAQKSLDFISQNFKHNNRPGLFSISNKTDSRLPPIQDTEENILGARTYNLLFHFTGNEKYKTMADEIYKFLIQKDIALERSTNPGIILVAEEIQSLPFHITVVGPKGNEDTESLFTQALQLPSVYRRIECWDKQEGSLTNPDVRYPQFNKPAAFVCSSKRCSLPIYKAEGLLKIRTAQ